MAAQTHFVRVLMPSSGGPERKLAKLVPGAVPAIVESTA